MLGVRDGADEERFSSAMVAMVEGEGKGERTKNHFFNRIGVLVDTQELGGPLRVTRYVPHFGNSATFRAECRESAERLQ